jgi:hypothetical protein
MSLSRTIVEFTGGYAEMMNKFEKRLSVFAIVFVAMYIGAIALTIHSRVSHKEKIVRIESARPDQGKEEIILAELLLPMLIFATVTACFIIVRKKRDKAILALEESDAETGDAGDISPGIRRKSNGNIATRR